MRRQGYFKGDGSVETALLVEEHMGNILALLRSQAWSYQTSHWQVQGVSYYGDHLLFERLYESVQAEIDVLAEKLVGYMGVSAVDPEPSIDASHAWIREWSAIEDPCERALQSERDLQWALKAAYDELKAADALTLGLDDWLMATANAHEAHEYLLQQRTTSPRSKTASQLRSVWVVLDPEFHSAEVADIMASTDVGALARLVAREGVRRWVKGSPAIHKSESSARRDAESRIRHGQNTARGAGTVWVVRDPRYDGDRMGDILFEVTPVELGLVVTGRGAQRWASDNPALYTNEAEARRDAQARLGSRLATDSGAPSDEPRFFDNPEKREVREFAESRSLSNLPGLDKKPSATPPMPDEVLQQPGASEFSTLNRYLIETEEPVGGVPDGYAELPRHPDLVAVWGRRAYKRSV